MTRFYAACIVTFGMIACTNPNNSINKFSDPVIMRIADLQDRKNTDSLIIYLQHEDAAYRKHAVLAFASVQDSLAVDQIASLLVDHDADVRQAAAFALGQT